MGDDSGGESLEEPIEMQSGEELSDSDLDSEDLDRWVEDLEAERLGDASGDGPEGDDRQGELEEQEESVPKRPRVGEGPDPPRPAWLPEGYPTRYRGGPPRNPDGSVPPPPPDDL